MLDENRIKACHVLPGTTANGCTQSVICKFAILTKKIGILWKRKLKKIESPLQNLNIYINERLSKYEAMRRKKGNDYVTKKLYSVRYGKESAKRNIIQNSKTRGRIGKHPKSYLNGEWSPQAKIDEENGRVSVCFWQLCSMRLLCTHQPSCCLWAKYCRDAVLLVLFASQLASTSAGHLLS